ncbi:MAG: hypothetical protein F4110_07600 [Acidimicrobiaceae bacterium]|nr:hypothetical protein [Acidimicrobiaceae bacterium]MXZ98085.1 hypothetical protein [Acidimicrobiaceae bacterium]MYE76663.1 hypothetical protein [Acidimicrobiaceae bacterium]MYE97054.1 hypothetical protein [Acidimicrobiaceae bacterium]MYH43510.1 hypothetical protein [Acidimicrobiaceae bacterium]
MTAFHAVLEAASLYAADVAPLPHSLVQRGDLRIVEPPPGHRGRKRLALVRGVAPDMNVAQIMLTHTYPELADDADAVLSPEQSRLPFPVVVETHVWGPVWRLQVRSRLGYVSGTQLESIRGAVSGEATSVQGVHVGLPAAGLADHRRSFAEQEMKEGKPGLSEDWPDGFLDVGAREAQGLLLAGLAKHQRREPSSE